jgi:hypothetical protein
VTSLYTRDARLSIARRGMRPAVAHRMRSDSRIALCDEHVIG